MESLLIWVRLLLTMIDLMILVPALLPSHLQLPAAPSTTASAAASDADNDSPRKYQDQEEKDETY